MDREDDNFSYGEIYGIQLGRPRGKLPLTVKIILAVVAFIVVIACIGSSTFMPTVAVTLQDASRALAKMGINVTRLADVVSESADVFNPDNVDTVLPADFYTTYNIDKTKLSLERVRAMEAAYIMCTYDDGAADVGASGVLLYSQGGALTSDDYGRFSLQGDVVYASGTTLSRVLDWTTAFNYYTAKKTFGTDCSGLMNLCMDYVDMKTGSSYKSSLGTNTASMMGSSLFQPIDYNNLAPGDILVKRSGNAGHTVMFLGWEDKANKRAYTAAAHSHPGSASQDDFMKSVDIRAESINYMKYFHGMEIGGYTPSSAPTASGSQFDFIDNGSEKYVRCYIPSNLTYRELGGYSDDIWTTANSSYANFKPTTTNGHSIDQYVGDDITWQGYFTLNINRLSGLDSYKGKDTNGFDCLVVNGEYYYLASISQAYFMDNTTINNFLGESIASWDRSYVYRVNMTDGTSFNFCVRDSIGRDHSCCDGKWTTDSNTPQDGIKYHCVPMTDARFEKLFHAGNLHILEVFLDEQSKTSAFANYITANRSRHIQSIDLTNVTIQSLISGGTT